MLKNINTTDHFWNSPLQNSEEEIILRNVVILCQKTGLSSFSIDEYEEFCNTDRAGKGSVSQNERNLLHAMAVGGYCLGKVRRGGTLDYDQETKKYCISESTIKWLSEKYNI